MPRGRAKSGAGGDKQELKVSGITGRPIWAGSLSFGLISIPCAVHAAVKDTSTRARFHLLHDADLQRLERRMICPEHGKPVSAEHTVRGYEVEPGKYVVVEDEELRALAPRRSRTIEIAEFVPEDQIDPLLIDMSYFVVPTGPRKPYQLLVETLAETKRAGIAEFVMHTREYLAAVRSQNDLLVLHTLHYQAQIRPADEVPLRKSEVKPKELASMLELIKAESGKFDLKDIRDAYQEKVQDLVKEVVAEARRPAAKSTARKQPAQSKAGARNRGLKVVEAKAEKPARAPARKTAAKNK